MTSGEEKETVRVSWRKGSPGSEEGSCDDISPLSGGVHHTFQSRDKTVTNWNPLEPSGLVNPDAKE